jgi:hypothetical protein
MAPKRAKPAATPGEGATTYISDRQAESLGLDPAAAPQLLADAAALYEYVNRQPNADRDALVKWANSHWPEKPVDRLNAALAYLEAAGKVIAVP